MLWFRRHSARKSGGGPPHSTMLPRNTSDLRLARGVLECASPLALSQL